MTKIKILASVFVFLFLPLVFLWLGGVLGPAYANCQPDWCDRICLPELPFCCCPTETPTPTEPTPTEPVLTPTPGESEEPTPTPTATPVPSSDDGGNHGGDGGSGEAPVCSAPPPPAPTLLSVVPSQSMTLTWTAVSPVTHYTIAYGLSLGDYTFGVDNVGNVTSFTVGGLDPAADYCFVVRGVNDCAPGEFSNEICTGEGSVGGQVLGVSTLGATGNLSDWLFGVSFVVGLVCAGLGLRRFGRC